MLDRAADLLVGYWDHIKYDGHAVLAVPIPSESNDLASTYDDHDAVDRFVYAPLKMLESDDEIKAIRKEFSFFAKHADRRVNEISFIKCQLFKKEGQECEFCSQNPPVKLEAFEFEKRIGGFLFDLKPSENHPGHFLTYLEMINLGKTDYNVQPSKNGKCEICPSWWFSSVTEMQRHRRILHRKQPLAKIPKNPTDQLVCSFVKSDGKKCNLTFPTYHQLQKHKNKMKHKRDRKRKAEEKAQEDNEKAAKVRREKEVMKKFFTKTVTNKNKRRMRRVKMRLKKKMSLQKKKPKVIPTKKKDVRQMISAR